MNNYILIINKANLRMSNLYENIMLELSFVGIESKFTVIKSPRINYTPEIIFIASIFRIKDPYKNDNKYKTGLKWIIDNFPKHFNMALRIFIDDSIMSKDNEWSDLYDSMLKTDFIEIIHYDFPQFKDELGYHNNLFGTVIRTLPIFNFNGYEDETTISIDVDVSDHRNKNHIINYINRCIQSIKMTKNGLLLNAYGIETYMDNGRLEFKELFDKYEFQMRFIMQYVTCSRKLDYSIFIDFMKHMICKEESYCAWIAELNIWLSNPKMKKKMGATQTHILRNIDSRSNKSQFIYGIDEYFLNVYIVGYLLQQHIDFAVDFRYPLMFHYHYFIYNLYKAKGINAAFMIKFYNQVLGNNAVSGVDSIYINYKILDDIIFKPRPDFLVDYTKYDIFNKISVTYFRKIYNFLRISTISGELFNNIKDVAHMNYYKKYFKLLVDNTFDTFLDTRHIFDAGFNNSGKFVLNRLD